MRFFRDLSLTLKLTLIILLTTGMALLIACSGFVADQQVRSTRQVMQNLGITAEMIGYRCSEAILSGNQKSVEETLLSLRAQRQILSACVYDVHGAIFATYRRDTGIKVSWPDAFVSGDLVSGDLLKVFRKIGGGEETVGVIYLESSGAEIVAQAKHTATLACAVFAGGILLAWLFAFKLLRMVSRPVSQLFGIIDRLEAGQDFSIRAAKLGNDETGRLVDGFNYLVEQIEKRDAALQEGQHHFEKRVEMRTVELANSLVLLKQAQATAGLDQARFKFIFESVPVGISLVTELPSKGTTRMINGAHLRICGLSREEAEIPENFARISHPEDRAKQMLLEGKLNSGEVRHVSMEKRYIRPNGQIVWVVFSAQQVLYADGTSERLTTVVDITELKLAQQQAAHEQARFKFIFEALPVGISWFAPDKPHTHLVNPAHEQITGVSAQEALIPGAFARVSHPEDYERQQKLTRAFVSGEVDHYTVEKRYLHRDGRTVWVVLTSRMFLDATTGERQAVTTLVDITERKLAEARLAEASALLETLLNNSPDLIYFKDRDSRFVRVSTSLLERYGLSGMDEIVGHSDTAVHPQDAARNYCLDEREIIRTGIPIIAKLEEETRPPRATTWILTTKVPWRDSNGAIVGTFGISRDVTAAKKAELEIAQMHRKLIETSRQAGMAEVATGVLHSVGNVLNSVNVSITLVADHVRNSKAGNLAKLASLINEHKGDLTAFLTADSRGKMIPAYIATLADSVVAEQGTVTAEVVRLRKHIEHINEIVAMQQSYATNSGFTETVSIIDVVEEALRINAGLFTGQAVETVRDYQARPVVTTDRHQVMQILINLVRNAKDACDDSPRTDKKIILRVTNDDQQVQISVVDNGVGIAAENLTNIFNLGFTTRQQGRGFGLHSSALAAKGMGGSIAVKSDGPGHGATFTLSLPTKPATSGRGSGQ